MKFDVCGFFENLLKKFKFHYNQTRIKVVYVKTSIHYLSCFANFFLE